ncbi:aminopeptidase N [uncultured Corynebacterium sp.]|uniref:aminopeptidase N n=1 Tax=uncultured Corynebacterium sp. TaxID=159447 RepID=UPI0025F78509|nr:aminopeptidase N [uncultured Corynebacterium sp.]
MTSTNLTQTEAAARAAMLEVSHYDISLDVTGAPDTADAPGDSTFRSTTTITLTATTAGETFLDLRAADVRSVTVDGEDVTDSACGGAKERYDDERGLVLDLAEGEHEVVVDADCRYTTTGEGLHRFTDPADDQTYLYSQFETADAKRVFACFDQPDLKATYSMDVTAPGAWTIVSNSAPEVSDVAPADGEIPPLEGPAARIHRFRVDVPLSTYLIAFCAGPWHAVHDEWTGTVAAHPETPADHRPDGELTIPLGLFCRASIAEHLDAETLFRETKEGFDWYAANFGEPYPFGKYDQIFCPEYNMGAMENAGAVTIRDEYIFRSRTTGYLYERRNETVLHEMAHMWFGDLVTMEWWDDLWLNESFATWSACASQAAVSQYDGAWTTFANVEKAWAYQQDQLPSTHPIAADASDIDTVDQNFDGITYAKGASVLKQLAAYVGEDAFLAGARLHFARHRFANATFDDLLGALSEASGRDLSGWADQWLTTTGINTLSANFRVDQSGEEDAENATYSSFSIGQTGAEPGAGELRDHRVAVGVYALDDDGALRRTQRVEVDVTGATTEVPELVGAPAGDVVLVNDDDLTYCLMEFDSGSMEVLRDHIGDFADAMPRTLTWSTMWEMTRAAKVRARDFVDLVLRGAPVEDQISVLERVLAQAVSAVERYADRDWVDEGRALLGKGLLDHARAADGGSDQQLAFVNALAMLPASQAGTVEVFRAILAGSPDEVGLDGITVDDDMKWKALTVLVAAGDKGLTDIAAAEQTDRSALGAQSAAKARAAIPDLDNKIRVWNTCTSHGDAAPSNLMLRHMMAGFTAPGADETLRDFTDRYFTEAPAWWGTYSSETAQRMLDGLYPHWEVSKAGVDKASELLSDDSVPAPVKRVVAENRDRVARALRARECDAFTPPVN